MQAANSFVHFRCGGFERVCVRVSGVPVPATTELRRGLVRAITEMAVADCAVAFGRAARWSSREFMAGIGAEMGRAG